MSEHYPQDNACQTCLGMLDVVCDRCDGKGCRHCGNTGLIDCPTCGGEVPWQKRMAAIEARQDRIEAMLIAKGYKL